MNQGKYIFAQLTDFLPPREFDRIVEQYDSNKYVKSFKCWNHMLCMVFGQLTARDSMRDLMLSIEAHKPKYYHLGFESKVTHRNLGKANDRRNCKIFEEFAYILIEEARRSCYRTDFEIDVEGNVYVFDSTTMDLCLSPVDRRSQSTIFLLPAINLSEREQLPSIFLKMRFTKPVNIILIHPACNRCYVSDPHIHVKSQIFMKHFRIPWSLDPVFFFCFPST